MWKWTKRIVLVAVAAGAIGFVLVGTDLVSYGSSSVKWLKDSVKDSVPIEFEIQRARDLLEDLVPEMHSTIKQVAREEVEVAMLEQEIARERQSLEKERAAVQDLRDGLQSAQVSFRHSGRSLTRAELVAELGRRFEHLETAELLAAGKDKLLENRKAALNAALKKLEKTRVTRIELAAQVEALESQFRLIQAQAQTSGSQFQIDDSKLARTQKLLRDLHKRLAVAQKVLAQEARFVENIEDEPVSEPALLERVDKYLTAKTSDNRF
jgi:peptidoglycan hydrolase CwlO-like protein